MLNPIKIMATSGPAFFPIPAWSMAAVFLATATVPVEAQPRVPDFGGVVWARDAHDYPKPYLVAGTKEIANGYNNEYLKGWVVELLMRDAMVTRSGRPIVTAHSVCFPEGVPYVFGGTQFQFLHGPSEITMLFGDTGQSRTISLNRPHSKNVVPSWYGESVGHFEGNMLVVDTIGIAVNPQSGSMGFYGTPHTERLHLVERYRFLADGEPSMAPPILNDSFDAAAVIHDGKKLRLTFTLEDPVAYKKPWSVTLDYVPIRSRLREYVCAQNSRSPGLSPLLPTAEVPDF